MTDKRTHHHEIVEERSNESDEAFELAYFTNSYPHESSKTKTI